MYSDSGSPGRAKIWPRNIRGKILQRETREFIGERNTLSDLSTVQTWSPWGLWIPKSSWLPFEGTHILTSAFPRCHWTRDIQDTGASLQPSLAVMTTGQPFSRPSPLSLHLDHSCWPRLVRPRGVLVCLLSDGLVRSRRREACWNG